MNYIRKSDKQKLEECEKYIRELIDKNNYYLKVIDMAWQYLSVNDHLFPTSFSNGLLEIVNGKNLTLEELKARELSLINDKLHPNLKISESDN